MMISTRGRYALRILIDLAEHADIRYIPMKDVAERQGISLKYLERILPVLSKNGIYKVRAAVTDLSNHPRNVRSEIYSD